MRGRLTWGLVALAVIALAVTGWGMTGSQVSGSTVRARDGKPIKAAVIKADGEDIASVNGVFAAKLALGDHRVVVAAPGYEAVTREVKLSIFRGVELGRIKLRNADLKVKAVENYPGYPGLKSAKFVIAGRSLDASGGAANMADLPVGKGTLAASSAGCADATVSVNLVPGENSITVTMTPSLDSVVKRDAQNAVDRDLVLAWATIHPARQKQYGTEAQYTKVMEKKERESAGMISIIGFKVLTPTMLATYKDKPSKQTFKNVYAVPISYRVSSPLLAIFGQKEMTVKLVGHWKLVDGQWRDIGDGEPVSK